MSNKIDELNKKIADAFAYADNLELDAAIQLINELVDELSYTDGLKWNVPYLKMVIVFAEAKSSQIEKAIQTMNQAIQQIEQKSDKNISNLYGEIRRWLPKLDIEVAIELLQSFRNTCLDQDWIYSIGLTYLTEGMLFISKDDFYEAKLRFEQAHSNLLQANAFSDIAIALRNLVQANYDLGLRAQSHLMLMELSNLLIKQKHAFQTEDYDNFTNLCLNVDAAPLLTNYMFKKFEETTTEDKFHWLHKLLNLISKFNNVFENLVFEQTIINVLHTLAHPMNNGVGNEIPLSSNILSSYEKFLGIAVPVVASNMQYSLDYLSIFETYLRQSAFNSRSLLQESKAIQAKLLRIAGLDDKKQKILQESLNKRWRLSERTEKIEQLNQEFRNIIEETQKVDTLVADETVFEEGNKKQLSIHKEFIELFVTYSHHNHTLIIAMKDEDNSLQFFYRKLPNQVLNSIFSVLDSYPEYEMSFLGDYFGRLCLTDRLIETLSSSSRKKLLVVGDTFVQRIPWECIKLDEEYIGLKFAVSRDMSMFRSDQEIKANRDKNALIIANPTEDLPESEIEGKKVAEQLNRAGYNVTLLQTATSEDLFTAKNVDILHFAGHASFVQEYPLASYLRLRDRPVTLNEISNLRNIEGALVVLNACETAATSYSQKLGTQSFIQSFLDAKASTILGGLWPVADGVASQLMIEFYNRLISGDYVGEALHKARIVLKREGKELKDWGSHTIFGFADWQIV
jgi:CHAT domain-containing protein